MSRYVSKHVCINVCMYAYMHVCTCMFSVTGRFDSHVRIQVRMQRFPLLSASGGSALLIAEEQTRSRKRSMSSGLSGKHPEGSRLF